MNDPQLQDNGLLPTNATPSCISILQCWFCNGVTGKQESKAGLRCSCSEVEAIFSANSTIFFVRKKQSGKMADQAKRARDDSEPSESVSLDGDGTELLSRVVDSIDEQLFNEGLMFKGNMNWEEFGEELRDLLFRYYDDEGDDDDYDPAAPADDDEGDESIESGSSSDE